MQLFKRPATVKTYRSFILETTGVPIAKDPRAPVTTRSLLPRNYAILVTKQHEAIDREERVQRKRCYEDAASDWVVSEVVDHPRRRSG